MEDSAISALHHYLSLIRFSHTVFALPFAALACAWALVFPVSGPSQVPYELQSSDLTNDPSGTLLLDVLSWQTMAMRLLGIVLCMVFARSAAMAFNRLVDANYDAANPRTSGRHIPAGILKPAQVWSFFSICSFGFIAATLLFLPNWLPIALSVPVLVWLCGYSLSKRFTSAAHIWLGVALALSPVCAWIALRGEHVQADMSELLAAALLSLSIACWVAGFDIIYASQDAEFDRQADLHSIPSRLGVPKALRVAAVLHLLMWLVLGALPWLVPQLSLGLPYWIALFIVGLLLIRQHRIVSPNDLSRVNEAFFTLNAVISFGFTLVASIDAWF